MSSPSWHRHLPALPREGWPKQDLVLPLPALNPLHQSCPPRLQGVPVPFGGHEGPVPSVPAALHGPGVCVALFCTELPGFAFPMGIAVVFALLPSSGQAPRKQEVPVTAHVWGVPGPWCAFPALLGRAGSTHQCYRLAWAALALSVSRAGLSCCQELLPGRVPSSAGAAAFQSASVTDLAAVNPTA